MCTLGVVNTDEGMMCYGGMVNYGKSASTRVHSPRSEQCMYFGFVGKVQNFGRKCIHSHVGGRILQRLK